MAYPSSGPALPALNVVTLPVIVPPEVDVSSRNRIASTLTNVVN